MGLGNAMNRTGSCKLLHACWRVPGPWEAGCGSATRHFAPKSLSPLPPGAHIQTNKLLSVLCTRKSDVAAPWELGGCCWCQSDRSFN